MLRLHLKFLFSLIRCFKLLFITKVFDCKALKLHLLSGILSLAWIFFRFRMKHRELIKNDLYAQNDLSFRRRVVLNPLTPSVLPIVATYPFAGERGEAHGCIFQRRKMRGVATNVYWKENVRKTKGNRSWRIFQIRELSLRLRKVLTPLTFALKDNSLRLELCEIMYLSFYFFFYFWSRQKRGSCSYVPSIEEEIRPA